MFSEAKIQELLQELVYARGPVGQEDEVRDICSREMENLCDKTWVDPAGNVIGLIKGDGSNPSAPIVRVMAHMDELSLIVKKVNDDGTLRVNPLGGIHPFNFGQGPVEILAESGILKGVLSLGPMHTTKESSKIWDVKPHGSGKSMTWHNVNIFTRETPESLKAKGVFPGTRIVIPRAKREIEQINDCLGGYFFDNRAAIVIALLTAKELKDSNTRPANDVYICMTTSEEIGGVGAVYASRVLPGDVTLAVDVGPVAKEYGTELNGQPIVVHKDNRTVYDRVITNHIYKLGLKENLDPQVATWESYGSDASYSKYYGQAPKAALICIPTDNTHGFELIQKDGIKNCSKLLTAYLKNPV